MKLYEYQARALFEQYGISVPSGFHISTPEEAASAFYALGSKAVLKGQVLTGGRGKAGIIRKVNTSEEAESIARELLEMSVKGFPVKGILVTEFIDIQAEYYASVIIDREKKEIVLIVSEAGGMEIEEIASQKPEFIKKFSLFGTEGESNTEKLSIWLSKIFPNEIKEQAISIVQNMYRLFREKDCSLVEINPLALTRDGLTAADAKIVFDDNGLFKHTSLTRLRNPEEYTEDEIEARKAGLSFVSLEGQIGCMVNGAGLAMATMDCIKLAGASPANFLDVGGSSNPEKVINGMRILLKNNELKAILINIFGGITRCDDIAKGIISASEQLDMTLPVVIRLIGTNEEKGREMLSDAGFKTFRSMPDAISSIVEYAAEGV
ncbi:MAG: ADP-forming succinate--CoA ligase subunit beta [Sedimentisphaerales bacterium]